MSNATSLSRTVCDCRTLSADVKTYGSGLTVPGINLIDFSHIFANFLSLLAANSIVTTAIVSNVTVYVILVFWARRADRRDIEKVGTALLIASVGLRMMFSNEQPDMKILHFSFFFFSWMKVRNCLCWMNTYVKGGL